MWLVDGMYGWLKCIGMISGGCCKEVTYIDFLIILLISTPLVLVHFLQQLLLCSFFNFFRALIKLLIFIIFSMLIIIINCFIKIIVLNHNI